MQELSLDVNVGEVPVSLSLESIKSFVLPMGNRMDGDKHYSDRNNNNIMVDCSEVTDTKTLNIDGLSSCDGYFNVCKDCKYYRAFSSQGQCECSELSGNYLVSSNVSANAKNANRGIEDDTEVHDVLSKPESKVLACCMFTEIQIDNSGICEDIH